MSERGYYQVTEGEWLRIPWRQHKDACCDCGLVHIINYRAMPDGTLEMQVSKIDKRATAARRRKQGKK